jgi:hypothetical protein
VNISEYISSGIIEAYCLGLASPEEAAEFEAMCSRYPELVSARDEFERSLEQKMFEQAIEPDKDLKGKVMSALAINPTGNQSVISMYPQRKQNNAARWIAAASLIFLVAAGILAYSFYSKNSRLNDTAANLQKKLDSTNQVMDKMAMEQKLMTDPAVTVVNLTPIAPAPQTSVNVYWDSASTDVYLVVKNLPAIPSDKQYQLWALINGKPKDLGLFDQNNRVILKMNNTQKADAFAITVENRGHVGDGPAGEMTASGKKL